MSKALERAIRAANHAIVQCDGDPSIAAKDTLIAFLTDPDEEMVEVVAKGICAQQGSPSDCWNDYCGEARAAIAALLKLVKEG